MHASNLSQGLGDSIAKITSYFGIRPCGGCERRRELLNRWVPYPDRQTEPTEQSGQVGDTNRQPIGGRSSLILPTKSHGNRLDLFGNFEDEKFGDIQRSGVIHFGRRPIVLASAQGGGWPAPGQADGPLDREGARRVAEEAAKKPKMAPGTGPFACGIDVTESTKAAIRTTKSAFHHWTSDQRHESCRALYSLTTGDVAWDILELHSQVTSDTLNQPFRPICTTSGADPACGSSVSIGGSCHFAGSANYVIFGVMCRLCHDHYDTMLNEAAFYEVFDKDDYRLGRTRFTSRAGSGLVDLYKKYVPLLTGDAPAGNLNAAKRWSIAVQGWPHLATTPPPDRVNCQLTCPHRATNPFAISWYPYVNPYARRRGIF